MSVEIKIQIIDGKVTMIVDKPEDGFCDNCLAGVLRYVADQLDPEPEPKEFELPADNTEIPEDYDYTLN